MTKEAVMRKVVGSRRSFSWILLASVLFGCGLHVDSSREAERLAIPSADYPLAGFWKHEAANEYGLAIAPAGNGQYSISFCGPGSCFQPGTYRPNSSIVNDPLYTVVDGGTIEVKGKNGFSRYSRFRSRTSTERASVAAVEKSQS
jgi:hypothetical protein